MENNENQNGNMENINMETMMKLMQSNQMGDTNSGIQDKNQMLEAFILFQKFMNMNQMLDQQKEIIKNEISKNESQISQTNSNNFIVESNNINNNKSNNNNINKEIEIKKEEKNENNSIINSNEEINKENNQNIKQEKKEIVKPRIRRGENKNIENEKKEKNEIEDQTIEKKENIEISNTEKIEQPKNKIEEPQNKKTENEINIKETKETKEITEEKIESINNITKEEKETNKETISESSEKKLPPPKIIQNFDDIPIKSGGNNFMDLLEKNLENEKNLPQQISQNKPIRKYTPNKYKKQIEISKPQKGEMKKYKYYTDNFEEANPYNDRMNREEKAKQAKEKAREIENKQKIKIEKKNEIEKKIISKPEFPKNIRNYGVGNFNNKSYKEKENDGNDIIINESVKSKWSKANFNILEGVDDKNDDIKKLTPENLTIENNNNSIKNNNNNYKSNSANNTLPGLEFGGNNKVSSKRNLNLVVGIQQNDNFMSVNNIQSNQKIVNSFVKKKKKINQNNNYNTLIHQQIKLKKT